MSQPVDSNHASEETLITYSLGSETIEEASKARFRRLADALPPGIAATDVVQMLEVLTAAVVSSAERETQ